MVYRYSWVAGFAGVGFAVWELNRLLLPTVSGTAWQLVVLAGFLVGLIITWTAVSYRLSPLWIAAINVAVFVPAVARFASPGTAFLVFPTGASFAALWTQMVRASDLIRHGIDPVRPIPGIVIVLTALLWLLGALLAWGLSKDHPFVALAPPIAVGLLLATLNHSDENVIVITAFVVLIAFTTLSVGVDERERGAGRMSGSRRPRNAVVPSPTAAVLLIAVVAAAVFATGWLGPGVPSQGLVPWRTPGGLGGDFFGSVTYNPYVQIHDRLVSQEGIPLFRATVTGDVPADQISFRLLTLDTYRNGQWAAGRPQVVPLDEGPPEPEGQEFAGDTADVTSSVEILALSQEWMPAPYAARAATGEDEAAFRIRPADTSLFFRGDSTYRGMRYDVTSRVPILTPRVVAAGPDGELSPLFSAAAADGKVLPLIDPPAPRELPDPDRYTALPPGLDPQIRAQARALVKNLETPFEQGLAIEHWFRETGGFVYDLDAETGHSGEVLAAWLFDDSEDNPGYRRGYCEQFATSMGVMTRSLGIPTRVVLGFTPGVRIGSDEVEIQDKNAHSWVELWIPTAGWVSFDPTPRSDGANPATSYGSVSESLGYDIAPYLEQIPEPERPEATPNAEVPGGIFAEDMQRPENVFVGSGGETETTTSRPVLAIFVAAALALLMAVVLLVPLIKWVRRRIRMRRLSDGDVSAAWEEIVVRLTDMGNEPDPAATPLEVAGDVDEAMVPLATVYSRSIYGPTRTLSPADVETARRSMEATGERLAGDGSTVKRFLAHFKVRSLLGRFRR
jgi:transglutaminase-like putative cysteine protease